MFEENSAHITGPQMMRTETVWATVGEVSRLRSRILNLEQELNELKMMLKSPEEQ